MKVLERPVAGLMPEDPVDLGKVVGPERAMVRAIAAYSRESSNTGNRKKNRKDSSWTG